MAFTFAHPAAVMPFLFRDNKKIDNTALIIGSMAPDFEYFIHFKPMKTIGHTVLGQFYFSLPFILIVACIYHYILKQPIIDNLPRALSSKLQSQWKIDSFKKGIIFAFSALIGAFTHLIWDFVNLEIIYGIQRIEGVKPYIKIINYQLPIYRLVQHTSTLIGFMIIALCISRLKKAKIEEVYYAQIRRIPKVRFWVTTVITSLAIMSLILFKSGDLNIGHVVVTGINSMYIGIFMVSVGYRFALMDKNYLKASSNK